MTTTLRTVALALMLTAAVATAQAGVKASAVNPDAWYVLSPADAFVALNAAKNTTLTFKLSSAGKKLLTYSAQCAVDAPTGNTTAWLDIDIYVNGVVVAPTVGNSDAFCAATGRAWTDGYVQASITIPIQGIAGTNTVRIMARGNYDAFALYLGNSALVISD